MKILLGDGQTALDMSGARLRISFLRHNSDGFLSQLGVSLNGKFLLDITESDTLGK